MVTPPSSALSRPRDALLRIALAALCGVLLLLPVALLLQRPLERPQLTLLGAGDSLSLLLEGAGGGRVLVGGGATQSAIPAALGRHLRPWDGRIDLLIVADRRDLPGATELVRRGVARSVATVGLAARRDAAAGLASLREVCAARGIPLRAIEAAEEIAVGRDPRIALTIAPPDADDVPPRLAVRAGLFAAPILVGPAAGNVPATGAILLRANQEMYGLVAAIDARLIAAPAPPTAPVFTAPEGRYLLLIGAGERATLIVEERALRLRGAALTPLDAIAERR